MRNPAIAMAMRRIEMCEQAGTGLRMMRREWQALGHAAPQYFNDRVRKAFQIFLPDTASRVAWMGVAAEAKTPVTGEVTGEIRQLVLALTDELTRKQIQGALGLKGADHFRNACLVPAIAAGLVEMTIPEKPRSRLQKYRLTEAGRQLQAMVGRE